MVVPQSDRFSGEIYIPQGSEAGVGDGELVLVRVREPQRGGKLRGEVLSSLRDEGSIETDLEIITNEFELPGPHGDLELTEAGSFPDVLPGARWPDREDLRDLVTFTIDPIDANDFDDAISLEPLPRGASRLGVHIADVSHYVRSGSPLDETAEERGTSVYLPGRVIDMLPHRLANELCSLRPQEDRPAKTVFLTYGRDGALREARVSRSVIHSRRRFTYEEVQSILDWIRTGVATPHLPPDHAEYEKTLKLMDRLRRQLRRARRKRGSLAIDLPKLKLQIDSRGEVGGLGKETRDDAHELIEDFMLAANEAVASYFTDRRLPLVGRVHPPPEADKLAEFKELVEVAGFRLRGGRSPRDFQRLVDDVSGSPLSPVIQLAMLRTMGHAEYTSGAGLHFALATDRYCHFTSPIRRYPDLLVHQVLDEHLDGRLERASRVRWWERRLPALAAASSELERRAEAAERAMLQLRLIRYLEPFVGQEMEGWIISVHDFGFFVRIEDTLLEGLVHVATLGSDFYEFDADALALVGRRTRRTFRLGDRVRVVLSELDPDARQIGFRWLRRSRRP